jgi:ABC-type phosphate transport system permease subunit
VAEHFGALPYLFGTLVSAALALVIALPLGIGTAVFLAELAPPRVGEAVAFLVELLAAIPSIVYGSGACSCSRPWLRVRSSRGSSAPRLPAAVPGLPVRHRHAERRHRARR